MVALRAAFGEPRKMFHKKILGGGGGHRGASGWGGGGVVVLHPAMFLYLVANLSIVPYFAKNGKPPHLSGHCVSIFSCVCV